LRYDLTIDYWTDCVGTFDPLKVVGLAKRAFPGMVVDETDFEAAYLERLLALIEAVPEPVRATMTRQAKRKAMAHAFTSRSLPTPARFKATSVDTWYTLTCQTRLATNFVVASWRF
jgi:hypothetical protein